MQSIGKYAVVIGEMPVDSILVLSLSGQKRVGQFDGERVVGQDSEGVAHLPVERPVVRRSGPRCERM